MKTKASWQHLDISVDESDPFDLREVGLPIDLLAEEHALHRQLAESLRVEAALDAQGRRCPIKDDPYASCAACSVRHRSPGDPLTPLCTVGVEQERVLTALAIARHAA